VGCGEDGVAVVAFDAPVGGFPGLRLASVFGLVLVVLVAVDFDDEAMGGPAEVGFFAGAFDVDLGWWEAGLGEEFDGVGFGVGAAAVQLEGAFGGGDGEALEGCGVDGGGAADEEVPEASWSSGAWSGDDFEAAVPRVGIGGRLRRWRGSGRLLGR
jgi:hypothetical protein